MMKGLKTCVLGCCVAGVFGVVANAQDFPEIALVPMSASGDYSFDGDEIILEGGGQQVFLEIYLAGWDPDGNGDPKLKTWQARIDSSGYTSGLKGALTPWNPACTGDPDCTAWLGVGSLCDDPGFPPGGCAPGFIDETRGDYVFAGVSQVNAVDTSSMDYIFGATTFSPVTDPGVTRYGGNLVLDVPADAFGTFTISFMVAPQSFLKDQSSYSITPLTLTSAVITVHCVTDAICDDGNLCTDDVCDAFGICQNPNNTDPCDDADPCTVDDTCSGGSCQSGDPPDCSGVGTECEEASCDPEGEEGNCDIITPLDEGTECGNHDDTECTDPDTCDGYGDCLDNHELQGTDCGDYLTDDDCTDPDSCDGAGNCDPHHETIGTWCGDDSDTDCTDPDTCDGDGNCDDNHAVNGSDCSDGLYCNVGETCTDGECVGGTARDCNDGIPCTTDTCDEIDDECDNDLDPGFCLISGICRTEGQLNPGNDCEECNTAQSTTTWSPLPAPTACGVPDDTDCTDPDTCDGAGTCEDNHEPDDTPCTDDGIECTSDYCTTGDCTHPNKLPGTPCGDPTDTGCDNPDTCDASAECQDNLEPNGTDCDDEDACNIDEACQDGSCTGGGPQDCSEAGDQCNTASCDPLGDEGNCDTWTPVLDGTECDDELYCNVNEACWSGICSGGEDRNCDDSVGCTDDSCNEGTDSCDNVANDTLCPDDDLFCNGNEYCHPENDCDHTGNPCGGPCDEEFDRCLCEEPTTDGVGGRYLKVLPEPQGSDVAQAILITPDCVGGVGKYVGAPTAMDLDHDGLDDENIATLVDDPFDAEFRTPPEWGELYVYGEDIVPETPYIVQGDAGSPGNPGLSYPATSVTVKWGDAVGDFIGGEWTPPDGVADFNDITALVDAFRGLLYAPPLYTADLGGQGGTDCTPNQIVNFIDIASTVDGFRGFTYSQTCWQCPVPCP
ncbi:MAG: hypothetical protein WBE26_13080 [Phycisphaerae bacterium]